MTLGTDSANWRFEDGGGSARAITSGDGVNSGGTKTLSQLGDGSRTRSSAPGDVAGH